MTSSRRAGAPRLIEWTGERCVPWAPDVQVVYEPLHRYMWAATLVGDRRVLDLASGEGFGAALLADSAQHVTGVDIDERTVQHSALNYGSDKIDFQVADATDLSRFADGSFGAVVAFEMIEHVYEQERVLEEIARVLEPDGLLVISTPDRRAYSDTSWSHNPFHVRELDLDSFATLMGRTFGQVAIWGQRTITGSVLAALNGADDTEPPARTFFIERTGDTWRSAPAPSPLYLVAVASNVQLPAVPSESTLADCGLELQRSAQAASASAANEQLAEAQGRLTRLQSELGERRRAEREATQRLADRELEVRFDHDRIAELTARTEQDRQTIATARTRSSQISWRLFDSARRKAIAALGGERSLRTRVVRRGLRMATGTSVPEPEPPSPIVLPVYPEPQVSLVIPVYSGAALTRSCLESIRDNTTEVSYEVILVDDAADAETKALLDHVRGARILTNETNAGYQESVRRGAAEARGRWLVLCNNDIQPQLGWLVSMLACADSADDIAIVTPKYLYPDYSLSEAGGVIWRDGTGGNYGRGEPPGEFLYEFRREVDYGSAAALMVRADFWRDVGGFDPRFAPMYYEDTDLCFQAREHSLRVMFEPRANVIHVEGATAGTDITQGPKRYQEINRVKFVEKWRRRLDEQLPANARNARRASNRHRGPHVLIIDHRVPMADRDSGSLRMRGMIRTLQELGCRVTFFPEDRHFVLPYTLELLLAGVEVWYDDVNARQELAEIGPGLALVICSRPHTTSKWLDLIRECAPTTPVIYDTVDLHWLREGRREALMAGSVGVALGPRAFALREIELALIRATDATLVVSPEEQAQVEADVPGAVVRVVPNVNDVRDDVPPADGRSGLIFIGGFEHTPNTEAALRLVNRVMPKVWERMPGVTVKMIGGQAPPEVDALASPLVDVTGWVPDVAPLFASAVAMVAPLSYGAGLKGKVTHALAEGLPVVTTPLGAEGLGAIDGQHLLIGFDDDQLARQIVALIDDRELWARLSAAGQQLVAERCSPAVMSAALEALLAGRQKLGPTASPITARA